jgi:hypothetical protein
MVGTENAYLLIKMIATIIFLIAYLLLAKCIDNTIDIMNKITSTFEKSQLKDRGKIETTSINKITSVDEIPKYEFRDEFAVDKQAFLKGTLQNAK